MFPNSSLILLVLSGKSHVESNLSLKHSEALMNWICDMSYFEKVLTKVMMHLLNGEVKMYRMFGYFWAIHLEVSSACFSPFSVIFASRMSSSVWLLTPKFSSLELFATCQSSIRLLKTDWACLCSKTVLFPSFLSIVFAQMNQQKSQNSMMNLLFGVLFNFWRTFWLNWDNWLKPAKELKGSSHSIYEFCAISNSHS